ncbi:MAG: hypothetical protein HY904_18300 [Deltaproteobacteria bacterium]|nr:hypothetical protein [Deltaproteobacteria bacterium]
MMQRVFCFSMVVLAGSLVACGSSKEEKKPEPKAAETLVAAPTQDEMVASCVKMREQMFGCKEEAIDLLMAERAKVNPEMAAALADAAKKTEMRTLGLKELEEDGGGGDATLAARTDKCKAVSAGMPAQVPEAMIALFKGLPACMDKPCAERVTCYQPFIASTLKMPPPAAAAATPPAK